jgi:transglutaminase-like putative cysteine protease
MIDDRYVEEGIRRGLRAIAQDHAPGHLLPETFDQTRRMAQVSSSRAWRSATSRAMPLRIVTAGLVVTIVSLGLGLAIPRLEPASPLVATVSGVWASDPTTVMTIERDPSDDRSLYWRAAAYDRIEAHGLSLSSASSVQFAAGSSLPQATAEDLDRPNLRPFTFTVVPGSSTARLVVSPGTPLTVNRPVTLTMVGPDGDLAMLSLSDDAPYTVTARVPDGAIGEASELRDAGTMYPPEVARLYTVQAVGIFGPNLRALQDEIVRTSDSAAPYDLAETLVTVLRSARYTYDTDVRDIDCETMSAAECFAATRRGYCIHYSMTMAVILRNLGVPARVVEGFLPGDRSLGQSTEVIRNWAAHAWVEVYFPGVGWVAFDPTPTPVANQRPIDPSR